MVLSECIDDYIKKNESYLKERTIFGYKKRKDMIIHIFGDVEIEEITQEVLQNYINEQQSKGKTICAIKNNLTLLVSALKPYKKFDDFKYARAITNKKEKEVYSDEDIDKIEKYIISNDKLHYRAIMIAINTGMRISEINGLKWGDIDFKNGTISVERNVFKSGKHIFISDTKTFSGKRKIPINKILFEYLKRNFCKNEECFVVNDSTEIKNQRAICKSNENLCKKLGIKPLGMHAYRHAFATKLLKNSNDFKSISQIMGHSNIAITQNIYNHPDKEQKQTVIDNAFAGNEIQEQPTPQINYQPQFEFLQNQMNDLLGAVNILTRYIRDNLCDLKTKKHKTEVKQKRKIKNLDITNALEKLRKRIIRA